MTRAFLILTAVLLTGCSERSTRLVPSASVPIPPELSETIASPCPPASLLQDRTVGTLSIEDARLSALYAECQKKHWSAVKLFIETRNELIRYQAKLREQEQ